MFVLDELLNCLWVKIIFNSFIFPKEKSQDAYMDRSMANNCNQEIKSFSKI